MTARATGAVSTAPTATRRDRSRISARRSAASSSSPGSSCPDGRGPGPVRSGDAVRPGTRSARRFTGSIRPGTGPPAVGLPSAGPGPPAGSTISRPCTMFMPQAKRNSPARSGVSSTVVRRKAGSGRFTPKSGNTTRAVQSPDSRRSKVSRSGTPCRTRITSGEYPPLTVISASCPPSRGTARPARRGPKKNQASRASESAARRMTRRSPMPITGFPGPGLVRSLSITPLRPG